MLGESNMSEIVLRTATILDFDGVLRLLPQLWPDKELNRDALQEVFARGIGSSSEAYFCAETEGKIVGFCSLSVKNSLWQEGYIGYVLELVVDSSLRGQGIGTNLLRLAVSLAKEKDCRRIELDSAFHRKEAHRFYEGIGFENRAYVFSMRL